MRANLSKRRRDERGFSLVELMTVVAIIGIISSIAIPMVRAALIEAEATAAYADLVVIRGALEQYRAKQGVLPSNTRANNYGVTPDSLQGFVQGTPFSGRGFEVLCDKIGTGIILFVRPKTPADKPLIEALSRLLKGKVFTNGRTLFVDPFTNL